MPPERRAVLLLLGLAVGGQGVRALLGREGTPPGQVHLGGVAPSTSSLRAHRDSAAVVDRPLRPGERIDLDRASVSEVARLPRVGHRLAKAIVADRERHGPFGRLEAVDRVPGVGPGLLATLTPYVSFSRLPAAAMEAPPADLPVTPTRGQPVDLNRATREELEALPFLGPYMAGQIVAWRSRHGPFPSVDSLVHVPGVGPATVDRVRPHLRVD